MRHDTSDVTTTRSAANFRTSKRSTMKNSPLDEEKRLFCGDACVEKVYWFAMFSDSDSIFSSAVNLYRLDERV